MLKRFVSKPRVLAGAVFVVILLLGLLTTAGYGQPWDELDEMDILRMNLWEYARCLKIDTSAFEARAAKRELSIQAIVPISESVERDHGMAAFYPLAGAVMNESLSPNARMLIWHGWCWVLFTLGAFALYAVCRELTLPRPAAVLAALFLMLSPRFFAEGHYNNKDIALMALVLCVLWQALALRRKPGFGRALAFALCGAFAANLKIAGLAVWGLCALYVLIALLIEKRLNRRAAAVGLCALVGFIALYALLTPALWREPAAFIKYLLTEAVNFQRWKNLVLFRGTVFDLSVQKLPWYYLPYMIFATTPLWLTFLLIAGQLAVLWLLLNKAKRRANPGAAGGWLLCTLLWLVPLAFAVLTGTNVYNGWRHFYFLYGPILALCACGACAFWQGLRNHLPVRRIGVVLLACCMVLTGAGIALQHPYQFAYVQPLVQLRGDGYLELDYWNVAAQSALYSLAEQQEGTISIGWSDIWAQNAVEHGVATLPDVLRRRFEIVPEGARYILQNKTYEAFSDFTPAPGAREALSLSAYGHVLMRIYDQQP